MRKGQKQTKRPGFADLKKQTRGKERCVATVVVAVACSTYLSRGNRLHLLQGKKKARVSTVQPPNKIIKMSPSQALKLSPVQTVQQIKVNPEVEKPVMRKIYVNLSFRKISAANLINALRLYLNYDSIMVNVGNFNYDSGVLICYLRSAAVHSMYLKATIHTF